MEKNELFLGKYRIESIRLPGWNYSNPGYYFITICTKPREPYFGCIKNNKIHLSNIGKISQNYWNKIPEHFPHAKIICNIIMPDHLHGILGINIGKNGDNGFIGINEFVKNKNGYFVETQNFASLQKPQSTFMQKTYKNKFGPQSKNLSSIIRGYKMAVKKWATINDEIFSWQPHFYDHIVHDDYALNRIENYINNNPQNWKKDRNNKIGLWM